MGWDVPFPGFLADEEDEILRVYADGDSKGFGGSHAHDFKDF